MENISKTNQKKYYFFYFTLLYIVAFLIWWTYLLYHKNASYYDNVLSFHQNNAVYLEKLNATEIHKLEKKYQREKIMIITEGAVFLIVLLVLIFRVKKAVEQEIYFSKQQQNFILSITHELKSPLSSIKLMSQTLAKHQLNEEQKQKLINNSLSEVDRLQNLVENVLLAAKIDNNSYGFSKGNINLSELCKAVVQMCITSKMASITAQIQDNIQIEADQSAMTSILVNLLENAIKYSNNAPIVFELQKQQHIITINVKDEGIGILESERQNIFEKFYRIGNEETRATKGTGLGLYIVKQLVHYHNGTIKVYNNIPKGSIFEVKFQVLQ
jgi:two-component system phosphate regulon sensor histidine kinase PhoR